MTELKKYNVEFCFSGHAYVEVEAENDDKAKETATDMLFDMKVGALTRFDINASEVW